LIFHYKSSYLFLLWNIWSFSL